jgi:hypothetical protein
VKTVYEWLIEGPATLIGTLMLLPWSLAVIGVPMAVGWFFYQLIERKTGHYVALAVSIVAGFYAFAVMGVSAKVTAFELLRFGKPGD